MTRKPGRNAPCPCGSGKKFKTCHGGPNAAFEEMISRGAMEAQRHAAVSTLQRTRQQGLGRGILSMDANDKRLVVVGSRLCSGSWKTFHDFLYGYIVDALGHEWVTAETAKPPESRHPILGWRQRLAALSKAHPSETGALKKIPLTGAVNAYLTLAHDLYTLEHNAYLARTRGIQALLLARLKHTGQFVGARYEVRIAAMFLRAGFELTWEDETDRSSDHCEFTATYAKTGKSFWVECKMRNQSPTAKSQFGFGKFVGLVSDALRKETDAERIIFVDINTPAAASVLGTHFDWRTAAVNNLRRFEGSREARELPSALIIVTNFPDHHHLDDVVSDGGAVLEGFKTDDYRTGQPTTVRQKIEERERHPEIKALFASIAEHTEVPASFDGEIAGLDGRQRLLIGHAYEMDDGVVGILEDACVDHLNRRVWCTLRTNDGRRLIYSGSLSDQEFAAWRRYPETFFGDMRQGHSEVEDPIELFDRILAVYSQTPKENLLVFMAPEGGKNREALSTLDQPDLAERFAEGITSAILRDSGPKPVPIQMQRMRKPPSKD